MVASLFGFDFHEKKFIRIEPIFWSLRCQLLFSISACSGRQSHFRLAKQELVKSRAGGGDSWDRCRDRVTPMTIDETDPCD